MNKIAWLVQLMVATTLVLLCTRPPIAALAKVGPWLLPLPATAIIGREVLSPFNITLLCSRYCMREYLGINNRISVILFHGSTNYVQCFGSRNLLTSDSVTQITMSALREWAASQGGDVHKVQYVLLWMCTFHATVLAAHSTLLADYYTCLGFDCILSVYNILEKLPQLHQNVMWL